MTISQADLAKIAEAVNQSHAVTPEAFEALKEDVAALAKSVESLVSAWKGAGVFVGVVKWIAGVVAAVAAAWAAIVGLGSGHH